MVRFHFGGVSLYSVNSMPATMTWNRRQWGLSTPVTVSIWQLGAFKCNVEYENRSPRISQWPPLAVICDVGRPQDHTIDFPTGLTIGTAYSKMEKPSRFSDQLVRKGNTLRLFKTRQDKGEDCSMSSQYLMAKEVAHRSISTKHVLSPAVSKDTSSRNIPLANIF